MNHNSSFSTLLNPNVFHNFMTLPQEGYVQAEYVWVGGSGHDYRSKTKTLVLDEVTSLDDVPIWNYDGSSTEQAPGDDSEVYLKPVAYFRDPFRRGKNILVLCETCLPDVDLTAIKTNTRRNAVKIFEEAKNEHPWFGIEQEYTLFYDDNHTPFGWPRGGFPSPQGQYYCSAGTKNAFGRRLVEAHYRACMFAGITISGINAEVMAGQWEYQVGPCEGIDAGDHLVMSRYILQRISEDFGLIVSFNPKPMDGDWNGAGCHTNYSTKAMREDGGFAEIVKAIKLLEAKHMEHQALYGKDNHKRMTGLHETARYEEFTWGVANRGASVRVGRTTKLEGKGYMEDRRPASNMDPYVVTAKIALTTIVEPKKGSDDGKSED